MTRQNTAAVILLALGSILLASCTDRFVPDSDVAEHLWRLEEAYIQAHVEADHQAILSLWDEEFLA